MLLFRATFLCVCMCIYVCVCGGGSEHICMCVRVSRFLFSLSLAQSSWHYLKCMRVTLVAHLLSICLSLSLSQCVSLLLSFSLSLSLSPSQSVSCCVYVWLAWHHFLKVYFKFSSCVNYYSTTHILKKFILITVGVNCRVIQIIINVFVLFLKNIVTICFILTDLRQSLFYIIIAFL